MEVKKTCTTSGKRERAATFETAPPQGRRDSVATPRQRSTVADVCQHLRQRDG